MAYTRYIHPQIMTDLSRKMVFIGGPRQAGKTTLAKSILNQLGGEYFNWDDGRDRSIINRYAFAKDSSLLIFDELHKKQKWKSWIKGVYDTRINHQKIIVTGSARLDVYKKGGDSLVGRYHHWRLHPFTLDEYAGDYPASECLQRLMMFGGFPEPFLLGDTVFANRWRRERMDRLLRDDIRDLENIRGLQLIENLTEILQQRVGTPIVTSNVAELLQVAPKTVTHWLEILERLYIIFIVRPFTAKIARAIQKPPRVYFYDNMDVQNPEDKVLGARFENLVATHLLKKIHFLEDSTGDQYRLNYLRDKDGREVDFVITKNKKILELIEVKYSSSEPSPSLAYYNTRLAPARAVQIVHTLDRPLERKGIKIMSVTDYFPRKVNDLSL